MQMGIFRAYGLRKIPKDEAEALQWYILAAAKVMTVR
jgi:TPR repeat protein